MRQNPNRCSPKATSVAPEADALEQTMALTLDIVAMQERYRCCARAVATFAGTTRPYRRTALAPTTTCAKRCAPSLTDPS